MSVVSSTSNPASSAALSKLPLFNVSQPCALASLTVWPCRARAMPRGVPWSKRITINGGLEFQDSAGAKCFIVSQKPQGTDADRDGKAARAVDQRERSDSFRTPAAQYPGKGLDSVFQDHRAAALSCLGDIREVANIRGVVIAGKIPKDETQNRQLGSGFPGDLERYTYDASCGRDPHHAVMCASAPPPGGPT